MNSIKNSARRKSRSSSTALRWSIEVDASSVVSVHKCLRISCKPSTTMMEIKKKLRKYVGYPLEFQRLYVRNDVEVKNHIRIIDLDGGKFDEDDVGEPLKLPVLTFKIRLPAGSEDLGTICFYGHPPRSKTLFNLMMEAQAGFAQRLRPERVLGGSAGTYIMRNHFKDKIACFKPFDEEPFAPNNPQSAYVGSLGDAGLRDGIRSGEGCLREVAAYLIDATSHFHSVPYTCLAEASDDGFNYTDNGNKRCPKLGSFQEFVNHDTCMSDLSPSLLDIDEVHKIGLLDIRIMNVDRNDGNVLVSWVCPLVSPSGHTHDTSGGDGYTLKRKDSDEKKATLIPIDHGYCLPDRITVDPLDWCWFYWKQAKSPFSDYTKKIVSYIDVDADAEMLRREVKIDLPSLRIMRVTGRLMKIGVHNDLTLSEIAEMIARMDMSKPSVLEIIFLKAYLECIGEEMPSEIPSITTGKCEKETADLGEDFELCNISKIHADSEDSTGNDLEVSSCHSPIATTSSSSSGSIDLMVDNSSSSGNTDDDGITISPVINFPSAIVSGITSAPSANPLDSLEDESTIKDSVEANNKDLYRNNHTPPVYRLEDIPAHFWTDLSNEKKFFTVIERILETSVNNVKNSRKSAGKRI